jgi:hypothetical protein
MLLPANQPADERAKQLEEIQIIKDKIRVGKVDKVVDSQNIHIKDLFTKETALEVFVNLKVTLSLTG